MGFLQAEDVTLPARFLTLIGHLIATLIIVLDLDRTACLMSELCEDNERSAITQTLGPLAYTAIGSLLAELAGLFLGATIFNRPLTCLQILLHFLGAILVGLFIDQGWSLDAYITLFTLFNVLPCTLELSFGVSYLRGRFMEYRK
mmetsp:Transcript_25192/g.59974  ORF Transcript_25192/g.59974 Transcript_25192/m.59974 type:complete len:145 (-) Transcript_25192:132-566(-)